jgi:transcriptional regulator with XRE-family HTH domain
MVKRSSLKQGEIAQKLGIDRKTLGRYQNGSRPMPVDLYWDLVRVTRFYAIIPLFLRGLSRYWHKRPFKRRKTKTKKEKSDKNEN